MTCLKLDIYRFTEIYQLNRGTLYIYEFLRLLKNSMMSLCYSI